MMADASAPAPTSTSAPKTCVVHAWLRDAVHRQLVAEADRCRIHPDRLVADIVEVVVLNGLVDDILRHA